MNFDSNKRILDATLGELEAVLMSAMIQAMTKVRPNIDSNEVSTTNSNDTVIKGLAGIQEAFQCGRTKAVEIKNSGVIDEALDFIGARNYIVHVETARELYNNHLNSNKQ